MESGQAAADCQPSVTDWGEKMKFEEKFRDRWVGRPQPETHLDWRPSRHHRGTTATEKGLRACIACRADFASRKALMTSLMQPAMMRRRQGKRR